MDKRIVKNCLKCSGVISVYLSRIKDGKGKYCSKKCYYQDLKGKKQSPEYVEKRMLPRIGKKIPYRPKPSVAGKNNPNWRGGITKLRDKLYKSINWKNWRTDVFKRDNYTCQKCSSRGYLEAHHIIEFCFLMDKNNIKTFEDGLGCKDLWKIENGKTLCKDCHNKTKMGNKTLEKAKNKSFGLLEEIKFNAEL